MAHDYRIIVAGGRRFNDYEKLSEIMDNWRKSKRFKEDDIITIVCGCAEGADDLGRKYALEHGLKVAEFPANWNIFGKTAGILRNKEMAAYASKSESGDGMLFAFWNGESKGTKNMIDTAIQYELPITIFAYPDPEDNANNIITEYVGNINNEMKELVYGLFNAIDNDHTPVEFGVDLPKDSLCNDGSIIDKKISITVKRI